MANLSLRVLLLSVISTTIIHRLLTSKTDNAWACDKIIWWGAWYAANWVVACDVCVYQKRKLLSKQVRNVGGRKVRGRLAKSICTLLSMWPCTLKSDEVKWTYVRNCFSPVYFVCLLAEAGKKAQHSCAPAREECNKHDVTAALSFLIGQS
jgi:hypothetical protein